MSLPKLNIAITGGTGFLGRHLVRHFVNKGDLVCCLIRPTSRTDIVAPPSNLSYYVVNEQNPNNLEQPLKDVDIIIHAATTKSNKSHPSQLVSSNVLLPLRVLEAAQDATKAFINCDTILPPERNEYAHTKYLFKQLAEKYLRENSHPLSLVHLELHRMYGPGDQSRGFIPHVIQQCLVEASSLPLSYCEQVRDFIFIEDVVSAFDVLVNKIRLQSPLEKQYSLGTGNPVALREIAETIKHITGAKTELKYGAIAYEPNEDMVTKADPQLFFNLGWEPRFTLEKGLQTTIEQFTRT